MLDEEQCKPYTNLFKSLQYFGRRLSDQGIHPNGRWRLSRYWHFNGHANRHLPWQ